MKLKLTRLVPVAIFVLFSNCDNSNNKNTTETKYYRSGKLKATINSFNEKRNRLAIFYYENGNIEALENYINDTINGKVYYFYSNGILEKKFIISIG